MHPTLNISCWFVLLNTWWLYSVGWPLMSQSMIIKSFQFVLHYLIIPFWADAEPTDSWMHLAALVQHWWHDFIPGQTRSVSCSSLHSEAKWTKAVSSLTVHGIRWTCTDLDTFSKTTLFGGRFSWNTIREIVKNKIQKSHKHPTVFEKRISGKEQT